MSSLDPLIHPLPRFKVCATLRAAGAVEGPVRREMRFRALRDATELSDASLSKHLAALEEASYVTRFREYGSTRAKDTVWVMLSDAGRAAFDDHLTALRELAGE